MKNNTNSVLIEKILSVIAITNKKHETIVLMRFLNEHKNVFDGFRVFRSVFNCLINGFGFETLLKKSVVVVKA